MLEAFSENVIQSIVIAQDLARLENSEFVEFNHILEGLILNKRSSAGYILNKLKIQEKKYTLSIYLNRYLSMKFNFQNLLKISLKRRLKIQEKYWEVRHP